MPLDLHEVSTKCSAWTWSSVEGRSRSGPGCRDRYRLQRSKRFTGLLDHERVASAVDPIEDRPQLSAEFSH